MPEPISREKLDQVIERIAFEKMSVATACEGICEAIGILSLSDGGCGT